MLDGLLGRGFASKCKSLIKLIKRRIDVIRKKRNAREKFLKKDIADLLSNGLDINAFGRADGLIADLCVSACYDFVEHRCDFIVMHLHVMQKQSECPEDCKEAVSSLMFAAARFSDLPELRDLRHIFHERYGNSLELFVNQKLVENLASNPSTMEKKVQLMQDIASEFSLNWDSKAFEQRMSKPSASAQDQHKIYGSYHSTDDKYKSINRKDTVQKGEKHDVLSREQPERANDGHRLHNGKDDNIWKRNELVLQSRQELFSDGDKPLNGRDEAILRKNNHDISSQGRREVAVDKHAKRNGMEKNDHVLQSRPELFSDGYKPLNGRDDTILKMDNRDISLRRRREVTVDKQEPWNGKEDTALKTVMSGSSSHRKRSEGGSKLQDSRENTVPKRDSQDPLPHKKPEIVQSYLGLQYENDGKDLHADTNYGSQHNIANSTKNVPEEEKHKVKPYYNSALPPPYVKPNVKPKNSKYGANAGPSQAGFDGNGVSEDPSKHNRANAGNRSEKIQAGLDHADHEGHYQGGGNYNFLPKARSVRRRHSKSRSSHDDVGNEDTGVVTRKSRSRRRDDSRRGLQILFDDEHYQNDEEERIIDKLLIHYSKKPAACEPGKVRRKSRSRHAHHQGSDVSEAPENGSKDGPDESDMVPTPVRSISLPREQTAPPEAPKVFARAASFQPDRSNPARHVHPKLPDYDDLAARFAALKGR